MTSTNTATARLLIVVLPGTPGSELDFRPNQPEGAKTPKSTVLFGLQFRKLLRGLLPSTQTALRGFDEVTFDGVEGRIVAPRLVTKRKGLPRWTMGTRDFATFKGYDKITSTLASLPGVVRGHNMHEFPFDWRRSNLESGANLATFVTDRVAAIDQANPSTVPIVIVAHSSGGVVAHLALRSLRTPASARRTLLVTMGTPWLGLYKSARAGLAVSPPWVAKSTLRFPGVAELILATEGSWGQGRLIDAPIVKQGFGTSLGNVPSLLEALRQPGATEHFLIYGNTLPTANRAARKRKKIRAAAFEMGDDTVPVTSALYAPPGSSLSSMAHSLDHDNMIADPDVVAAIRSHIVEFCSFVEETSNA